MGSSPGEEGASFDWEPVLAVVAAVGQIEDARSFGSGTLKALSSVLSFDIGSFNEVDASTGRALFCAYPDSDYSDADVEGFPELIGQNPILQYQYRTGDGSAHRISDFMDHDELHRLELYQRVYAPLGVEYQVAVGLTVKTPFVIAFALNRRLADFTNDELRLLDALRPHLIQAYRNTQVIEALQGIDGALAELGEAVVTMDSESMQVRASPWAFDTLGRYFGETLAPELPLAVQEWLAEERQQVFADGQPRLHRSLLGTVDDCQLAVRFIPGAGIRPDVLTLEEHRPERAVAELTRLGFTSREAEVVQLLIRGATITDAAAQLGVTTGTLNKHLEHIYRKFGVNNRSAAVAAATDALSSAR